jgi:hypothetical protein
MEKYKSVKSKQDDMGVASARKSAAASMEYNKSDSQDDGFPSLHQQETVAIEDSKVSAAPLWELKLLKQIEAIQKNKSKRRSAPPHMSEEQLHFAIRVMERSLKVGMSIPKLAEEVSADLFVLKHFLDGDPDARVRAKNHETTMSLLKKWMGEEVALDDMTKHGTEFVKMSTGRNEDLSPSSVIETQSINVGTPSEDLLHHEVEKATTGERGPMRRQKKTAMKTNLVEVRRVQGVANRSSPESIHLIGEVDKKQKESGTAQKEVEPWAIQSPNRETIEPKFLELEQCGDKTKGPAPEWKTKLLKLLQDIQRKNLKRRSAPPHLSEEDLEVAIKVRESMELLGIDIEALAETLKVSDRNLEYFLSGDETKQVFARQHRVTRILLEEWLQKNTNGIDDKSNKEIVCGSREKRSSASLDQSSPEPASKKPKRDDIANLAIQKSHAEFDYNSDYMLASDSESEESMPDIDWDARLAELLALSQTGGKTHMTKVQLEIAVRVRCRIAEIGMSISALSDELDLPLIGMLRFLEGDKDAVMGEGSHNGTEAGLKAWLEKECTIGDNQSQAKPA